MNIAVSVDDNLTTGVFDFTPGIIIYTCVDGKVLKKKQDVIQDTFPPIRASRLEKMDIDVLICENVSNTLAAMIWHMNINIISGVSETADASVEKYLEGTLTDACPGYRCFSARRWRGGGRRMGMGRRRNRNI